MKESIKHELGKSYDDPNTKPVAKAKVVAAPKMVIPADGKVVAANPGYWVVTASDAIPPADAGVVFGRARSVIAWVVGADTATPPYPVTARPFDPGIETVALVELDGSVIGLDDTHYGSQQDWQAAVTAAAAAEATAAAEAAATEADKKAKKDAAEIAAEAERKEAADRKR